MGISESYNSQKRIRGSQESRGRHIYGLRDHLLAFYFNKTFADLTSMDFFAYGLYDFQK